MSKAINVEYREVKNTINIDLMVEEIINKNGEIVKNVDLTIKDYYEQKYIRALNKYYRYPNENNFKELFDLYIELEQLKNNETINDNYIRKRKKSNY